MVALPTSLNCGSRHTSLFVSVWEDRAKDQPWCVWRGWGGMGGRASCILTLGISAWIYCTSSPGELEEETRLKMKVWILLGRSLNAISRMLMASWDACSVPRTRLSL